MGKSVLVKGRNAETARAVLAAAERLGLDPSVVRTSSQGGYLVPEEVQAELANATPEDDFETRPLATRTYALASDEVGPDKPQDSPEGIEVVERSTPSDVEGPQQTGAGRAYDPDAGQPAPPDDTAQAQVDAEEAAKEEAREQDTGDGKDQPDPKPAEPDQPEPDKKATRGTRAKEGKD